MADQMATERLRAIDDCFCWRYATTRRSPRHIDATTYARLLSPVSRRCYTHAARTQSARLHDVAATLLPFDVD